MDLTLVHALLGAGIGLTIAVHTWVIKSVIELRAFKAESSAKHAAYLRELDQIARKIDRLARGDGWH